jgi:hypothetical protein
MHTGLRPLFLCFLAILSSGADSRGDIIIASRNSNLTANYVFGNINGPTADTDQRMETTTISSVMISGSRTGSGDSGDVGWVASYEYEISQYFDATSNRLQIGGSSKLFSFYAQEGISLLTSENRVVVEFQNTAAGQFHLGGILSDNATLSFEQFIGNQWNMIYDTAGIALNQNFSLDSGTYRISAKSDSTADNTQTFGAWDVTITAVPEPNAMCALVALSVAGYLYRHNRRTMATVVV